MKKLVVVILVIGYVLLGCYTANCQSWNVEIQGDQIEITEDELPALNLMNLIVKWEYIFHGDCWNTRTGKLEPAHSYTFALLPELTDGLLMQKVFWFGQVQPNGTTKWTAQTSTCYRRAMPQCTGTGTQDTVFMQPVSVTIPAGTQTPDWYYLTSTGNIVKAEPNGANPGGVQIEMQVVINSTGYLMPGPENLPPGMYYMTLVLKWQGMYFIESDPFTIF